MLQAEAEPRNAPNSGDGGAAHVRTAVIDDVPLITALINGYAARGIMLPRSQHQVYQFLRDFVVVEANGELLGCGALHIVWADLAEVRSLAVREEWRRRGIGRLIVEDLLRQARDLGLPRVFALTYQTGFFARLGFQVVPHDMLPHKIWGDCLNCPKYPNCDEMAMMLDLKGSGSQEARE